MIIDYKKYELFGKPLLEKMTLTPPFKMPNSMPDKACFLYLLEGEINYEIEEEKVEVLHKDALLLNCSNSIGYFSNSSKAKKNELVIIHFHPEILRKIYDKELPTLLQIPSKFRNDVALEKINNDFLIEKYIEGLLFYFDNPTMVDEDILVLKLKEIILLLSKTKNGEAIQQILSQLFSPTSYAFKQMIEDNIFTNKSIQELADLTHLSLSSFRREFDRIYNDTPVNFFRNRKLEKAAELLTISNERITDIALDCGFSDLANFSKSFQEKFKSSPSNYRLKQKNKLLK